MPTDLRVVSRLFANKSVGFTGLGRPDIQRKLQKEPVGLLWVSDLVVSWPPPCGGVSYTHIGRDPRADHKHT